MKKFVVVGGSIYPLRRISCFHITEVKNIYYIFFTLEDPEVQYIVSDISFSSNLKACMHLDLFLSGKGTFLGGLLDWSPFEEDKDS